MANQHLLSGRVRGEGKKEKKCRRRLRERRRKNEKKGGKKKHHFLALGSLSRLAPLFVAHLSLSLRIAILFSTFRAAIARSSSLAATNGNYIFHRMSPLAAGVCATAGLVSGLSPPASCPSPLSSSSSSSLPHAFTSSSSVAAAAAAAPRRAFAAAAAGLRHNHRLALGGIAALSASFRLAAAQVRV